jgi:hypothetical protein
MDLIDISPRGNGCRHSSSRSNESLTASQCEVQNVHTELGNAAKTAENFRRNGDRCKDKPNRPPAGTCNCWTSLATRRSCWAEAKDEAARINQLRANDETSVVEQQARIAELS